MKLDNGVVKLHNEPMSETSTPIETMTYVVGDKVRANRYAGRTDYADTATVVEIRTRPAVMGGGADYIIRWDRTAALPGDVPPVSRAANALRPA